jgi:hypothetical protein
MSTTVEVAGTPRNFLLGSLAWDESIKSAGTATCVFVNENSGAVWIPSHGETFEVKVGGNVKFGGEVKGISEQYLIEGKGTAVKVDIQSYSAYLDDEIVDFEIADGAYTDASLITYLCSNYLGPDYGITADAANTPVLTLPALQFRNVSARSVLDTIMRLSGRVYRLSAAKLLSLYTPGAASATFGVTESDMLRGAIVADVQPDGYYNSIAVKGIFAGTDSYTGNGVLSAFGLTYDPMLDTAGWIVSQGYVTEAGVNYPIGVYLVDPLLWTFDVATNTLHRSSALGNTVVATFNYTVAVVTYEDAAEVTAHKRRKKIYESAAAVSADAAHDTAVALVRIGLEGDAKKIDVTRRASLLSGASTEPVAPSQVIALNIPTRNVASANYLIETVSVSFPEEEGLSGLATVKVTCREGSEVGLEWQDLFKGLSGGGGAVSSSLSILPASGGSSITGSGTANKLAKWGSSTVLTDSIFSESGSTGTVTGILSVTSDFKVNATKFTVDAATGNTVAAGTLSATGNFAINTNKFTVNASNGNTAVLGDFAINTNKFTVAAASGNTLVAGTLDATGDFKVNTNKFTVVASSGNTVVAGTLGVTGDFTINTNKFTVTASTGATVAAGTIRSTDTNGWAIGNLAGVARIQHASDVFTFIASSNATASISALDGTFAGNVSITGFVGNPSYASETTAWRITTAGEADFRYLFVDEMHAKSFIADLEQALAGGQIIGKSVAMVSQAFTAPSKGGSISGITRSGSTATATTAIPHGMSSGYSVTIAGATQTEYNGTFVVVVTGASTFTYTVSGTPATPATGTIIFNGVTTLWVRDLPSASNVAAFQSGDSVVLRKFTRGVEGSLTISECIGVLTSYTDGTSGNEGQQSWTFTRNSGADSGAMLAGQVVAVDSVVLDFGVSGNGYYEVSAIDGTVTVASITRVSTTATLTTSSAHGYQTGDSVTISGANETQYNGTFTITVTSATVFTYTVSGSPATPATGTILVNGTNGTNAPYAQIVTWATSPIAANRTVRTRFGNLRGLTGTNAEYGMIAGTYAGSNGQYFRASNTTFELHGIDMSLWDGSTNVFAVRRNSGSPYLSLGSPAPSSYGANAGAFIGWSHSSSKAQVSFYSNASNFFQFDGSKITWSAANTSLDGSGNLTATSATLSGAITATSGAISGDFAIGSGGDIRSVATSFASGTGFWIAYNAGTPQFRIGTTSGNRLSWDGTDVVIQAATVSINSGGITLGTPGSSLSADYAYKFTTAFAGTNLTGLFSFEPSGTERGLFVFNSTNQASKIVYTRIEASGGSAAYVEARDNNGTGTIEIACNSTITFIGNISQSSSYTYSVPGVGSGYVMCCDTNLWTSGFAYQYNGGGLPTGQYVQFNASTSGGGGGTLAIYVDFASDERLKRNIKPSSASAIDTLFRRLDFIEYELIDGGRYVPIGLSAQGLQKIDPLLATDIDGTLTPVWPHLYQMGLKAIQELDQRLSRIERLLDPQAIH